MKRTDVTYGQLDKVLRSLGFTCRLVEKDPPALVYEHKESDALIVMPPFPETDFVLDYHLLGARTTLDLFGIADPKVFDSKLQKAGRLPRRRRSTMMNLSLRATRFVIEALEHYRQYHDQQLQQEGLPEDKISNLENDRLYLETIKQELEAYRDTLTQQCEGTKSSG